MPNKKTRLESDSLGSKSIPVDAYWGIHTARAIENFPISGIRPHPEFIVATAVVKKAACLANLSIGLIDRRIAKAIIKASDEVITGKLHDQFVVDVYQAGAGTSHNMNANEVIANRALELLGKRRGAYGFIHPNDHVNMSQSTNDAMPTALRLACLDASERLINALKALEHAFFLKAMEFSRVVKSGRTHLQDASPITLGQEFGSYAAAIRSVGITIEAARKGLKHIGLGGTAVGTGINTHPRYRSVVLAELKRTSNVKGLIKSPDAFSALNSMADFVVYSGSLKTCAIELIRIANDLRLLSSGPTTGLAEITLPPVQAGSSIMPDKVNPVMAEMLNMVCFQVIGLDLAVTCAAQAGQLELNVMLPVINHNILESTRILANGVNVFNERCVNGIKADKARCRRYFEGSIGLATCLNTFIGYTAAALIAKEAASAGRPVKDVVIEKGILSEKQWERLVKGGAMFKPKEIPAFRR
ncbi:MAG: aspartate ammonia-lyase [Deltaproteobacteria bacterium]|nr:aspartate ammonia-lyase [Deltaproteobacteria bacterium]